MEHFQHHHPNSILVNGRLLFLVSMIERLYRILYLHRSSHPVVTGMQLKDTLCLSLRPAGADSS